MSSPAQATRIAVIGGGIGGLVTAISLRRLQNVDVQLFEQAKALREVGASIALGPNGLRGLEEMGLTNALSDEIGFRSEHGYPMVYKHWKTGEELVRDEHSAGVTNRLHQTARYYRPHLLEALAETLPVENLHLAKRLVNLSLRSGGVLLSFEDGTEYGADLVVGADGINSKVRSTYAPDYHVEATGQISLRAVFDSSHIEDLLAEDPNLENSVHVVGPNKNFFSSMMGHGKFTVVSMGYEDIEGSIWRGKQWNDEADIERLRDGYKDWHRSITGIVDRVPPESLRVFPGRASNQVPQPVHAGRIALVGDSFHPHGGAFATGGSMAIDDSIALFLALQHIQEVSNRRTLSVTEIARALDLYAATRLPHSRKVFELVERSRAGAAKPGQLWTDDKIRQWAKNKQSVVWLHEHDVHKAFEEALQLLGTEYLVNITSYL